MFPCPHITASLPPTPNGLQTQSGKPPPPAVRVITPPRNWSRAAVRGQGAGLPFLPPRFCVPSGIERLSASTSLATVEKIGPSSEASAASQSCSRRLTLFSGIWIAPYVRAIRFKPVSVSLAQLACRSGRPWPSVYLASMVARTRQPRTVHCAEYPHASN